MGLAELNRHLVAKHSDCAGDVYRDEYGYGRTTPLVSSRYYRRRSKEKRFDEVNAEAK